MQTIDESVVRTDQARVDPAVAVHSGDHEPVPQVITHSLSAAGHHLANASSEAWTHVFLLLGNPAFGGDGGPALDRARVLDVLRSLGASGGGTVVLVTDYGIASHLGTVALALQADRAADLSWWTEVTTHLMPLGVAAPVLRVGYAPSLGHQIPPEDRSRWMQNLAIARDIAPPEIQAALALLAGPRSRYSAGARLSVDGGMDTGLLPSLRTDVPPHHQPLVPEVDGLRDQTVLVVGASSGIGRAVARELAAGGAGVVGVARRPEPLAELRADIVGAGGRCQVLPADVTACSATDVITAAEHTAGEITAMVYASGVVEFDTRRSGPDTLDSVLAVNFRAYVALTRELTTRWRVREYPGSVVGISSAGAEMSVVRHMESYCASKGAMDSFTRAHAASVGRWGIRLNNIAPGLVSTPMADIVDLDVHRSWLARIPAGRIATPEDVAIWATYLVGTGSAMTTGQRICVDGGLSLRAIHGPDAPHLSSSPSTTEHPAMKGTSR